MEPKILYEDEFLLVLAKPAGWVVNDARTVRGTFTVQSWLKENFDYEISKDDMYRSGIVHRLDKDTSGILLIAKTKSVFENLQMQFKGRGVEKTYLALVHGQIAQKSGEIDMPVGRLPWNRERFGVLPGGREAVTGYKTLSEYELNGKKYSLLEAYPKTGRTHQIRIHFKYLGHPIVADSFYAGRKTERGDRLWCPRLFLHAKEIKFRHPDNNRMVSVSAELPRDLKTALSKLNKI
ncbi:MAG TPA: RluA family pseudouridine synthase [Candidatus Humimicrobiaceae bacterium]|nr:RluA family pseudouridine synthase [Candidatus Humimicrobiaceae bacterium]